jgi:hypothetical protein
MLQWSSLNYSKRVCLTSLHHHRDLSLDVAQAPNLCFLVSSYMILINMNIKELLYIYIYIDGSKLHAYFMVNQIYK